MKRNLFVISESEKERILGMHRSATNRQYLSEQASSCTRAPGLTDLNDEIAFRAFAKKNYGTEKVQGLTTPGGVINNASFKDTPTNFCATSALQVVYNHKPASGGGKSIGELYVAQKGGQEKTPDSYTVYKQDPADPSKTVPTKMTKDEITKGLSDGTLKKDVKVWDPSLGNTPVPITSLTKDEAIQTAIKSIAPELQKELSLYILDANNQRQGPLNATELEKQIVTDKTITANTKVWNGSNWVNASEITDLKTFFDKLGPQAPVATEKFISTNVPELDAWLKSPVGMAWDKMEEGDLKEKSLDTYTKSDPQLKAIADKIGVGKMRDALGTQRSTALGRLAASRQQMKRERLGPAPVQR